MLKRYGLKKRLVLVLGSIVALSLAIILWRAGQQRVAGGPISQPVINKADLRVEKMELAETRGGDVEWSLKAEKAEVYEKEGFAYLQNIILEYLLQGRKEVVLTGDRGRINLSKKDVFLQGNVGASYYEVQLKTDNLFWDRGKKVLVTDDAVWLKRENIEITGKGMVADINVGKIKLNKEIRTAIY